MAENAQNTIKPTMRETDIWNAIRQYIDAEIGRLADADSEGQWRTLGGLNVFNLQEDVSIVGRNMMFRHGAFGFEAVAETRDAELWILRVGKVGEIKDSDTIKGTGARLVSSLTAAKTPDGKLRTIENDAPETSDIGLYWEKAKAPDGRPILLKELAFAIIVAQGGMRGGELPDLMRQANAYLAERQRVASLPKQDVGTLHRQNDPTSKVANAMTDPQLFEAIVALDVAGKAEKKKGLTVETAVSFSWEGDIQLHRPISQWDREVHGGISSLWAEGQRYVSDAQIARATGIKNPTQKQVERVVESVELQRWVKAVVDFSQEARGRALTFEGEPVTTLTLDGPLISADRVEMKSANGKPVSGYVLNRAPLMYMHAAIMGQVTNYPQRLLELGEGRDTERNVLLRRELLRRVYRIRNKWFTARTQKARDDVPRNIRLVPDKANPTRVSLFEYAGVPLNDRDARKRSIEYVTSILDGVAAPRSKDEEHGDIADYKLVTETGRGGTKVVAIEIIL